MKLETLKYIHQLLIENENKVCNAKKIAREAWDRAEEVETDNCACLQETYENMRKAYNEAVNARMDFEDQEW